MKPSNDLRLLYRPRTTRRAGSTITTFLIGMVFCSSSVATDFATTGHVKAGSSNYSINRSIAARSLQIASEAEIRQAQDQAEAAIPEEEEDC